MTPDEPPEDPEHEAVVGEAAGGEDNSTGSDGGDTAIGSTSGGRRRPWRTVAIGLGSAAGVAGIAALSVFIYSIVDDDSGGWSTHDYSIVDDDSGGWFGYAPLPLDEDRRFDRDDERGDGRDRPVEVPHHGEGAGRAGDKGRPGSSAGHPDGTGGDKADGYEDAAAVAASKGCVEVKNLGRQVLLLCDRAPAGGKGVEGRWKDDEEPSGPDAFGGRRSRAWGAGPGSRWRGSRWWSPEDGLPNPRKFPGEDFYGLAPMDCREIPPWGTSPEGGGASGIECVTPSAAYAKYCIGLRHLPDDVLWDIECVAPSAAYCMGHEVDGAGGFSFEECYGFSGDFPPDWPGLERASPGGWFPFSPDDSPGGDDHAYREGLPFAFEGGFAGGEGGPSNFLEGWPAGPENPFGVPGANFGFGFDFEALVELLSYVLGGEMFEEFLGSILEGLLDGFEGLPEGEGGFDFDARDESNPGELLGQLDIEFLGLILEGLLAGLEQSPGAEVDLDPEGFGDRASDVLSEEWFEELFGSLLEGFDVEA